MSTRNILIAIADIECPSHKLVKVSEDHAVVKFCKSWEDVNGCPWIDTGNDTPELNELGEELIGMKGDTSLPERIDHIVHIACY